MKEKTVFYRIIDLCENSYYSLTTAFSIDEDPDFIVQEAAQDYYHDHDGWESSWPVTIALHETEGGQEAVRMVVDMEYEPHFTASRSALAVK